MSRSALLAELAAYHAADDHERDMVADVIDFLAEHVDGFLRTSSIGHITASAWIVDHDRTHALLTHHRKLGRWLQLGGHADGDEDVRAVALREAREESGLTAIRFAAHWIYDVDVHRIPARPDEPAHKHYDIRFALSADRGEPVVVNAESHALAWLPIVTLEGAECDPSVRRLARKTSSLPGSSSSS